VITVTLTFAHADEMLAFFTPHVAAVAAASQSGATGAPAASAPKRRGRPPKRPAVTQEMDATPEPAPVIPIPQDSAMTPEPVEAEVDDKEWTEVEVREVMNTFNSKFGIDALRVAIIEATGKGRMSEVSQEKYSALVARLRREMA